LTREPVSVSPTAHFLMGGLKIDLECRTPLEGLFAAGEDTAGVHGANRLGGNGVGESTVFGGLAGDVMARWVQGIERVPFHKKQVEQMIAKSLAPFANDSGVSIYSLRDRMKTVMWEKAGLVRNKIQLKEAQAELAQIRDELTSVGCPEGRAYNLVWMDILNMENYLDVSQTIINSALVRKESRGSHFRSDYPEKDDENFLCNFIITKDDPVPAAYRLDFSRHRPENHKGKEPIIK
ncbi:MAG: FAD-binding protein, partial [bacterium]|nr:FAD-binding protein [bacterium]